MGREEGWPVAATRIGHLLPQAHAGIGLVGTSRRQLEADEVGCVVLGDVSKLKEGDEVATTGKLLSVPVGKALLGRVVDALGNPLDGKGPIDSKEFYPVEKIAPGIMVRKSVNQPPTLASKPT